MKLRLQQPSPSQGIDEPSPEQREGRPVVAATLHRVRPRVIRQEHVVDCGGFEQCDADIRHHAVYVVFEPTTVELVTGHGRKDAGTEFRAILERAAWSPKKKRTPSFRRWTCIR